MLTTTTYAIESYDLADYPMLAALYDEDGQLHVECVAYGKPERCDYGVPSSPEWVEITDIEVDQYDINGLQYDRKEVVEVIGSDLEKELNTICCEAAFQKEDWS